MVNRRTILKIGATTVTGGLVNVPGFGVNPALAHAHNALQRAVFEEGFAECRAFAAEMNSASVLTSAIRGDVAELWYGDLRVQLSENRAPVTGMTDRAALFCLEELARDVNMRVVVRVDHVIERIGGRNGHVEHAVVGPASLVAAAHNLSSERGFGRVMAQLFSRLDLSEPCDAAAQKLTGPFSPENKTALVSWVIA